MTGTTDARSGVITRSWNARRSASERISIRSSLQTKGGHVCPDNRERAHILAQARGRPEQRHGQEKSLPLRQAFFEDGSPGWIRTTECLSQSQVPYRLATGL
jgi:hypothetical protein